MSEEERERLFEERLERAEFATRENFWEAREEYRRETRKEIYGDDFNPDVYNPDTVVGYLHFVDAVEGAFLDRDDVDPWSEKRIQRWRVSEKQRVNANERERIQSERRSEAHAKEYLRLQKKHERVMKAHKLLDQRFAAAAAKDKLNR